MIMKMPINDSKGQNQSTLEESGDPDFIYMSNCGPEVKMKTGSSYKNTENGPQYYEIRRNVENCLRIWKIFITKVGILRAVRSSRHFKQTSDYTSPSVPEFAGLSVGIPLQRQLVDQLFDHPADVRRMDAA